jgi:DNA-binding transcriptional LysR family regulator
MSRAEAAVRPTRREPDAAIVVSSRVLAGDTIAAQPDQPDHAGQSAGVDIRELRYFTVLGEELHFGRAAARLHISQPPLSQAIAQLENKLGLRLLDRTTRQVTLTPAGKVLSSHAVRILAELNDAVGATRRAALTEHGTLRIATGVVVRETVLPGLQYVIAERFPELTVEVTHELGDEVLHRIQSGAADLGVVVSPLVTTGLVSRPVRREQPVAVLHRDHALADAESLTPAQLAKHRLVVWPREQSAGSYDVVADLFNGRPPASVAEIELFGAGWWTEMRNGGFAVMPRGAPVTPEFVSVPITGAPVDFVTHVIWSKEAAPAYLGELLDAFDRFASEQGWL